ncbi:MAG: hypothetical protein V3S69_04915 [Dehalococcoidales bacterium]
MAGFTKADYDASYKYRVERHMPGGAPGPSEGRQEVWVHYHKVWMQPLLANRWAVLQPILNILSTDFLCVVGVGFGWGVDAAIAETSAITVGIDISDYIDAEQGNTEEAELRALVADVGLDPDAGRGLEVMNFIFDGQPRTNIIVLKEDMRTVNSRQNIRTALGGNWPTVVVYEDIIDDTWTDREIVEARNRGNGFGGSQRLIWIYTPTAARSLQDLFDLLPGGVNPSEVISPDGQTYLVV